MHRRHLPLLKFANNYQTFLRARAPMAHSPPKLVSLFRTSYKFKANHRHSVKIFTPLFLSSLITTGDIFSTITKSAMRILL